MQLYIFPDLAGWLTIRDIHGRNAFPQQGNASGTRATADLPKADPGSIEIRESRPQASLPIPDPMSNLTREYQAVLDGR